MGQMAEKKVKTKRRSRKVIEVIEEIITGEGAQIFEQPEPEATGFHIPLTEMLKKRRKHLGIDFATLSEKLCIQEKYLVALEEGRFDDLPDEPYRSGFLKSYVQYLDLDAAAILGEYRNYFQQSQVYRFPEPIEEIRAPRTTWVITSAALILVIYLIWSYLNADQTSGTPFLIDLPGYLK